MAACNGQDRKNSQVESIWSFAFHDEIISVSFQLL